MRSSLLAMEPRFCAACRRRSTDSALSSSTACQPATERPSKRGSYSPHPVRTSTIQTSPPAREAKRPTSACYRCARYGRMRPCSATLPRVSAVPPTPVSRPAGGPRPLDGVRVLELGQLMAGPWAGAILAYFGADVVKVEPPQGGDPVRTWRVLDDDGTSLWWRSLARNKRSVALDLRAEPDREVVRRLAA